MSDLRGKSGISDLTVTTSPTHVTIFETVYGTGWWDLYVTANVSGGLGPYHYAWSTNTGIQQGGANDPTYVVRFNYHEFGAFYSGEVRLVLTDQQSTQRTVVVPVQIEYYGSGVIWA